MKKFFYVLLFLLLYSYLSLDVVYAESSYVLPYPSYMPGSSFYKVHILFEKLSSYWYFGAYGGFKYSLRLSDKYLVEAKTLLEYKQYLLAHKALKKSDYYFGKISQSLMKTQKKDRNITQKQNLFKEAVLRHIEVLQAIKTQIPDNIVWRPEKENPTIIDLGSAINNSIKEREKSI